MAQLSAPRIAVAAVAGILALVAIVGTTKGVKWLATPPTKPPSLPIEVTYRSAFGPGYVVTLHNKASQQLKVYVQFFRERSNALENAALGRETLKSGELTISANGEEEIGWLEGVALRQGDSFKVSHAGYTDWEGKIPRSFDR
jgi:hypothetical protein